MSNQEWWRDFFKGLTVDMWQRVESEDQNRAEADFIQGALSVAPPAKVLDAPCGGGRLTLELARRGLQMTGIDISKEFLDAARAHETNRRATIVWQQREMRDLPWKSEFDGVFCFGNSFGYLDDDGNFEFLKAVHKVLKPGSRFVLDGSSAAENVLKEIKDRSEMQFGDILFQEENHYDHVRGRLDTEYTFVKGIKTEKRFGSHRIYTYREMFRLLEEAGFRNIESYGSLSREPYKFGAHALYFVGEKKR